MKTGGLRKKDFEEVAKGKAKPLLHIVREEAPARPLYETLSRENYRLYQMGEQRKQLAENLKNAVDPANAENLMQSNQALRYTPVLQDVVATQAAMQEKGGVNGIFSSAFSTFCFR